MLSKLNFICCIPKINLTYLNCIIPLICHVQFAGILLRMFASIFIKDLSLQFSFLVTSLSSLGVKLILASCPIQKLASVYLFVLSSFKTWFESDIFQVFTLSSSKPASNSSYCEQILSPLFHRAKIRTSIAHFMIQKTTAQLQPRSFCFSVATE